MKALSYLFLIIQLLGINFNLYAQSQMELNEDACQQLQSVDNEMNQAYQKVLSQYQNDKLFTAAFTKAQRQWLQFRDAHVASIYPEANKDEYGSVYTMCHCNAMAEITSTRLNQIKRWLDGVKEGDVCVGSVHVRDN